MAYVTEPTSSISIAFLLGPTFSSHLFYKTSTTFMGVLYLYPLCSQFIDLWPWLRPISFRAKLIFELWLKFLQLDFVVLGTVGGDSNSQDPGSVTYVGLRGPSSVWNYLILVSMWKPPHNSYSNEKGRLNCIKVSNQFEGIPPRSI